MLRILNRWVFAAVLATSICGCVVRDRTVACPPTTTVATGCVWVQSYRDSAGRIHAAHYRCPGTIDAY
jgi:hypothetical protein